jgi:hypothetical protein
MNQIQACTVNPHLVLGLFENDIPFSISSFLLSHLCDSVVKSHNSSCLATYSVHTRADTGLETSYPLSLSGLNSFDEIVMYRYRLAGAYQYCKEIALLCKLFYIYTSRYTCGIQKDARCGGGYHKRISILGVSKNTRTNKRGIGWSIMILIHIHPLHENDYSNSLISRVSEWPTGGVHSKSRN